MKRLVITLLMVFTLINANAQVSSLLTLYGIEVGKTSEFETLRVLNNNGIYPRQNPADFTQYGIETPTIIEGIKYSFIVLIFKNNTVVSIGMYQENNYNYLKGLYDYLVSNIKRNYQYDNNYSITDESYKNNFMIHDNNTLFSISITDNTLLYHLSSMNYIKTLQR